MADTPENGSDIADRIQDLRKALGWTQGDLAREMGRQSNTVSEWERGIRAPSRRLLGELCAKYQWPPAMFEPGGPMPSTVVNRALTGRVREVPRPVYPRRSGAALRYYNEVWRTLMIRAERAEPINAEVMLDSWVGLWRRVLDEAPNLGEPDLPPAE